MDSKKFFTKVREGFGPLSQGQVDGFNDVIEYGQLHGTRLNDLAYILATVWHETAFTMQPIKEGGGPKYLKSKKYYPYFGRGYVQLTWDYNYKKASQKFGVDFLTSPDKVMDKKYALPILFVGMEEGWFTTKALDDYIDGLDEDDKEDLREFANARRIINGMDKQVQIGQYAIKFEHALRHAGYSVGASTEPVQSPKPTSGGGSTTNKPKGFLELLIEFIVKLFTRK